MILAPTLTLNAPARGYDADATAFAAASGATDVAALSAFVKGVKELGLWNSMVCWPLRSSQNAGTGTTAYSLGGLGTFNGTLTNGPTWGVDGITFDGADDYIDTNFNPSGILSNTANAVGAVSVTAPTGPYDQIIGNETGGSWAGATGLAHIASTGTTYFLNSQNGGTGASITSPVGMLFAQATGATTNTAYKNGAVLGTATVTRAALANNNFAIGACGGGVFYPAYFADMTIAAGLVFSAALTNSQHAAFYILYRQTLGTGLGLP
jgi:hypothetical protein